MRIGGELAFVPIDLALRVAPGPNVTRVVGAPSALRGVALFEGGVVPVVAVGESDGAMLVCDWAGQRVGLVGLDLVASGVFNVDPNDSARVLHDGHPAKPLHLTEVVAKATGRAGA